MNDDSSRGRPEGHEVQIRTALSHIISSRIFQASPGLSRLLTFLIEEDLSGHGDRLKETYVGHALYGRSATYDPKLDSVVRVNANRLRRRLLDYHAEHPSTCPRIVLRPGSYLPLYDFDREAATSFANGNGKRTDVRDSGSQPSTPATTKVGLAEAAEDSVQQNTIEIEGGSGPLNGSVADPARDTDDQAFSPAYHTRGLSLTHVSRSSTIRRFTIIAICIIVGSVLIISLIRVSGKNSRQSAQWIAEPFSSLGGQEEFASISPNGRQVAFSWTTPVAVDSHIYIQERGGEAPQRLTSADEGESRPVWSPDGSSLAFVRRLAPNKTGVIVRSLANGNETKVAYLFGSYPWLCIWPRVSWSLDGTTLFTSESVNPGEPCRVVAINVMARSIKPVTQPPSGSIGDLEATVSPDGREIAFLRNVGTLGGDIYVSALDGANLRRVTFDNRDIMGFCWTKDGKGLIVSSRRVDGVPRLWQLSLDGKEAHPLTQGLTLAAFPSMSPKGDEIVLTTYRTFNTIWQISNGVVSKIISDQGSNSTPQLSPDGKALVYRSEGSGAFELWVSKLDGSGGDRITNFAGAMVNNPRWSPDGTRIAFECRPHGNSQICLVNPSQPTQPRVLNQWTSNEIFPSWSADGQSVYFASNDSGRWEIYKQNTAKGNPQAITHDGGMRAVESPDGRWLYIFRTEEGEEIVRLSLAAEPNTEQRVIAFGPPDSDMLGRWDATDNGIICLMSPALKADQSLEKETVVAIDGNHGVRHDLGSVAGPLPGGDLVFSTARNGRSFLYVKRELQQADLSFLVLGPKHGS